MILLTFMYSTLVSNLKKIIFLILNLEIKGENKFGKKTGF